MRIISVRLRFAKGSIAIESMSHALRHAPSEYGLTLNNDGTVIIEDLANAFSALVEDVLKFVVMIRIGDKDG